MSYQQKLFQKHQIPKSIQEYLELPNLVEIPKGQKIFQKFQDIWTREDNPNRQQQELSLKCKEVYEGLCKAFKYYQNPKGFYFKLIDSKFQPIAQNRSNPVSYACSIRTYEQDTFKDKLSELQVSQISESGTFEVKSQNQNITLPYVWQINTKIFLGFNKRLDIWRWALAKIYERFIIAKQTIITGIPNTLSQLKGLPYKFFSTVFGARSHQTVYQENCDLEITKDFLEEVYDKIYSKQHHTEQWAKAFWMSLFIQYKSQIDKNLYKPTKQETKQLQKTKNKLNQKYATEQNRVNNLERKFQQFDESFWRHWGKLRKKTIQEIQGELQQKWPQQQQNQQKFLLQKMPQQQKEELIIEKIEEKKFTMYLDYINEKLPKQSVNTTVIKSIVFLLRFFSIVSSKYKKFQKQRQRIRAKITKDIQKQFPIRSLSYKFLDQNVNQRLQPILKAMLKEYETNFDKDFSEKVHKEIYKIYLSYKNNYDKKLEEKRQKQKKIVIPARTFRTTYMLLPPYEVMTYKDNDNNITGYGLIKEREMTIDTRNHFWKFKLYAMRLKSWTINCFVFCFFWSIAGPFGIKCLFPYKQFQYGQGINYQTGEVYPQNIQKTVRGHFSSVLDGIRASRQHFESLPDRGLFGKKFSRIYNYIQCYIMRLLISGVLVVLILYPIAIVINVILSVLLILTVWLWVPMIMAVTYLFNIFIFQFEVNIVSSEVKLKSIPLISIVLKILTVLFIVLYCLVYSLIWTPIINTIIFFLHILRRVFRTITDKIMLWLIKTLGRVPSRDTAIAWKISGPGMSKTYFMSIKEENIYVLIQAQLEKRLLSKINNCFYKISKENLNDFNSRMHKFLTPYVNSQVSSQLISTNTYDLERNFQQNYYLFMNRYPTNPHNVRFTQQELDNYFENTTKVVQNFVQKYKLEDWIFQQFNVLEGAYEELTHKFWVNIFGCGEEIFQPLQNIDKRFQLEDVVSHRDALEKQAQSVMSAIRGQVKLDKTVARVGSFRYTSIHADPAIQTLSNLINLNNVNKYKNCYSNFNTISSQSFVPQMNIKQIRKNDKQYYDYIVQTRPEALNL